MIFRNELTRGAIALVAFAATAFCGHLRQDPGSSEGPRGKSHSPRCGDSDEQSHRREANDSG